MKNWRSSNINQLIEMFIYETKIKSICMSVWFILRDRMLSEQNPQIWKKKFLMSSIDYFFVFRFYSNNDEDDDLRGQMHHAEVAFDLCHGRNVTSPSWHMLLYKLASLTTEGMMAIKEDESGMWTQWWYYLVPHFVLRCCIGTLVSSIMWYSWVTQHELTCNWYCTQ